MHQSGCGRGAHEAYVQRMSLHFRSGNECGSNILAGRFTNDLHRHSLLLPSKDTSNSCF